MVLKHPFQKLVYVGRGEDKVLLAAAGPNINSFNLCNSTFTSSWPKSTGKQNEEQEEANGEDDDGQRPTKRQKVDADGDRASRESSESVNLVTERVERVKGERRKPKKVQETPPPNVSHLIATRDGSHVVAVTAEDKCVRVFQLQEGGRLLQLSERCMPKRPCAMVLTPEESTILVGDKFGDVYAMPFHRSDQPWRQHLQTEQVPFKPSATELTVHTKGNLQALLQQQKQKQAAKKITGPDFEHYLILGHVSLLTDLISVELAGASGETPRQYILTSDRDEHIRVSRGIPQAHIIETYCLHHLDFVSKMCVLPWQPEVLVSGSGEPSLKCYNWPSGKLLYNILGSGDEHSVLLSARPSLKDAEPFDVRSLKITISGLWTMQLNSTSGVVVVALEGLPALFVYASTHDSVLTHNATIHLSGNALDVAVIPEARTILVSLDTVHSPQSTKIAKEESQPQIPAFAAFKVTQVSGTDSNDIGQILQWQEQTVAVDAINTLAEQVAPRPEVDVSKWDREEKPATSEAKPKSGSWMKQQIYSPLGEFLYGFENLRKKPIEVRMEAERAEEGDSVPGGDEMPPTEATSGT